MKYFINDNEINFGDKIFHVKEGNFNGLSATTTIEGIMTKENVKYLIDLDIVKAEPDYNCEKEVKEEIIKELDKNIKTLEEVSKILEDLIR